jgi:hypothetical protein
MIIINRNEEQQFEDKIKELAVLIEVKSILLSSVV